MQKIALIIILLALTQSPIQAQNLPSGSVVSIGDGDTITINQDGQNIKIRLGCVDAPEMKQSPYGEASRNRLKALLPIGSTVSIREIDRDRYGRMVAEIYKGNESINLAMVKEGQAVIYRQYFDGCKATQKQFNQAESQAKQKKLGFWNQASPMMPWDFRKGKTVASPKTIKQPTTSGKNCDPSYPDFCIPPNSPDLDCKDISARRFRVLPPDPHKLDRDKDGVGCEN